MKHEIRIDYNDNNNLKEFLSNSYSNGILKDKNQKLTFDENTNTFNICKGLTNWTVRLYNESLIDGSLRLLIIEEDNMVSLYPCSIFYEITNDKYSFIV